MNIFPSEHERVLTASIFGFIVGLSIGLFSGTKIDDNTIYLASFTTIASAFIGAWLAFKLQDSVRIRKELDKKTKEANDVLFAIFQKLNALKLFQIDSISPHRGDPAIMFAMLPMLDFRLPSTPIEPEKLSMLLDTAYSQLLFDLHIEDQRFQQAESIIRFRSEIHFRSVQPALEAAGALAGKDYTDVQFRKVLGDRIWIQLEKATKDLIYHVDRTVQSGDQLGKKLIEALGVVYPEQKFMNFVLLNDRPSKPEQGDSAD